MESEKFEFDDKSLHFDGIKQHFQPPLRENPRHSHKHNHSESPFDILPEKKHFEKQHLQKHIATANSPLVINPTLLYIHHGLYSGLKLPQLREEIKQAENEWNAKINPTEEEENTFAHKYGVLSHLNQQLTGKPLSFEGTGQHFSLSPRLRHKIDQVVKEVAKVVTKVINVAKNIVEDAVFLPILPFKSSMTKALDKKGVGHDNTIVDIMWKFAEHLPQHFERQHLMYLHPANDARMDNRPSMLRAMPHILPSIMDTEEDDGNNLDTQPMDTGDAANAALSEVASQDVHKLNIGDVIKAILHFFEHLEGLPMIPPIPIRDDTHEQMDALHQAAKDQLKKEKTDIGIKGNLFGKKFDIQAFFRAPKKVLALVGVLIGIGAIWYFATHKK